MSLPLPPSGEQEMHVLETAMVECRRRLQRYRREGDKIAADLAEADLNLMLDRHAEIATGDTGATE